MTLTAICAFKAVRAEKVALALDQIGGATAHAHGVEIGERIGKGGGRQTAQRSGGHNAA